MAGIGAAMEQANAEAWEHTEVRRLQAVDNLKEAEASIASKREAIAEAEEQGLDEEAVVLLNEELEGMEEEAAALKAELAWLEQEMQRISDQLALLFGAEAAKAFLRSRSLAMAMMHDDVLAQASKDILAATRGALAGAAVGADGQVDLSNLLGSVLSSGGVGQLSKMKGSLAGLTESHSDASALVGAAQAGKHSSADGAALLEKVQGKLAALQEEGETLSGGADDVSRVLSEQPELLDDIKKLISIYIESTVMGMGIPNISGDKDWGRYSLHGLAIASVSLPPSGLDLEIGTGVRVVMTGVTAELSEFVWHYAKTKGFPKLKDDGGAKANIVGMDIDVSFDLVASETTGGLALANTKGKISLARLDVSVSGGKEGKGQQWLYNKLLKAFSEQIGSVVEHEMQTAMEQALLVVQDKVSAALAMFTGGEAGGAAALANLGLADHQQVDKYLVVYKCTCQRGLQPHTQTVGVLGVGKVVEILEEECTEAGVWRFRTLGGWSNRHQYNASAVQLKQHSKDDPREGQDVLRKLAPEEVALATAKFETDLIAVEKKIWESYLESSPAVKGNKKETKQAQKDYKKAKSGAGAKKGKQGQGARAAYAKRLVVALGEMQEDDAAGRWQFSESELLALAEAKAVDGALTY